MTGDRILLSGLRVFAHHGVLPHEAELGQVFVVDLELAVDLGPAGRGDDLAATVDYGALAAGVADLVASRPRRLLETVAEDVAAFALGDRRVERVRVRVTKPHAPLPVDAEVAVEVLRSRQDGASVDGTPANPAAAGGAPTSPAAAGGAPTSPAGDGVP